MKANEVLGVRQCVIEIDNPKLEQLTALCKELNTQPAPHEAMTVGTMGERWLKQVFGSAEIQELASFRSSGDEALMVRGMPLVANTCTPEFGYLPNDQCVLEFDLYLFGLLRLMDISPYAVDYENNGKLVRNVVPVQSAQGTTSSWGADVEFSWHTDNPNWNFARPELHPSECAPPFLAFAAVRNSECVPTDIVSAETVVKKLSHSTIEELRRAKFQFRPPASNNDEIRNARILPVVEGSQERPLLRFDDGAVSATDDASASALDALRSVLRYTSGAELVLESGDFLIFKNDRTLHRRRAFAPLSDGRQRWLRRCYGC